ncbi:transcriptional regulator with XRE-family HTH domain [Fusobacterium sp. PH5-7]|uniref:helix-turn-helix domain-containing protein n=1 Tax=Fusobacterium sp. PH5-7 TaxID=2940528 RepID=UPI0024730DF2|nr:helix-turn-helix transcriptional regulator [Fusobacterium sp. PH5-7]MDH6459695.1 transcriptional regulator with XRE-family HTH domain [Fusobacterium sp. PH5-7]
MLEKTIGKKIKEKREELGYSFGKLSNLSGVDRAEISRIESGDRKNPNPIMVKKIASALGMDIIELYEDMGLLESTDKVFLNEMMEILDSNDLVKILELYQKEISYEAIKQGKLEEVKEKLEGIQRIIERIK